MWIKIIMYHYIRKKTKSINLKYLDLILFEKQLDFFEKKYWFVSKTDWEKFSRMKEKY